MRDLEEMECFAFPDLNITPKKSTSYMQETIFEKEML